MASAGQKRAVGNGVSMDSLIQSTTTRVGGFDKSCTCIKTDVGSLVLSNGVVNPRLNARRNRLTRLLPRQQFVHV